MDYTKQDILDNMDMVHKIAHFMKLRHTNSLMDYDDLVSEGIFGLIGAFKNFDPEKGGFKTFAARKIKFAIITAHRKAFKQHRYAKRFGLPNPTYVYLDAEVRGDDRTPKHEILPGDYLSEDDTIDRIDSILMLKNTWGRLTFRQRYIIKLMLRGMTQGEAAEKIGVTPGALHSQYHKALGKIRDYHLNYRREER
jgi:RNA polymerase sigma factor (sigma-70 family)